MTLFYCFVYLVLPQPAVIKGRRGRPSKRLVKNNGRRSGIRKGNPCVILLIESLFVCSFDLDILTCVLVYPVYYMMVPKSVNLTFFKTVFRGGQKRIFLLTDDTDQKSMETSIS